MQEQKQPKKMFRFSIAPMIDVSNTHFRYFMRLLSKHCILYTEMIHCNAVLNNHQTLLPFSPIQHPVVLQLGGCHSKELAKAAVMAEKYGYDEINLNIGCPSPRVQEGSFGACLMKDPELVYKCVEQIASSVKVPVTVKCRLGVDDFDSYEFVKHFVDIVSGKGAGRIKHFVIHARKAFLNGLNPAQNRNIPPLMYQRVYQLKKEFPNLSFQLNGGIKSLQKSAQILKNHGLDGIMVGRLAYENPYELIKLDQILFQDKPGELNRRQILYQYADYVKRLRQEKVTDQLGNIIKYPNPSVLVKPLINLYNGCRNCGIYRRMLSDHEQLKVNSLDELIKEVADIMQEKLMHDLQVLHKLEKRAQKAEHDENEKKVKYQENQIQATLQHKEKALGSYFSKICDL